MRIAIIGWGSLIWDIRKLPPGETWRRGGPTLPIGWCKGPRPKLVVDITHGRDAPTHYVLSHRTKIVDAVADLCDGDDTLVENIGFVNKKEMSRGQGPQYARAFDEIRMWCKKMGFDAAVWRWSNEPAVTFH